MRALLALALVLVACDTGEPFTGAQEAGAAGATAATWRPGGASGASGASGAGSGGAAGVGGAGQAGAAAGTAGAGSSSWMPGGSSGAGQAGAGAGGAVAGSSGAGGVSGAGAGGQAGGGAGGQAGAAGSGGAAPHAPPGWELCLTWNFQHPNDPPMANGCADAKPCYIFPITKAELNTTWVSEFIEHCVTAVAHGEGTTDTTHGNYVMACCDNPAKW